MTPTDPTDHNPERPAADVEQPEPSPRKRVRVPTRRGWDLFADHFTEFAEVDVQAAGQWDATQWRDRPLP